MHACALAMPRPNEARARTFRADEIPTTPRGRRLPPPLPAPPSAARAVAADELPTTLRPSSIRTRAVPRVPSKPPPLPRSALPTRVREPLPSLASVLEPSIWIPSRRARLTLGAELRWLLRIVLLAFVIAGEIVLGDPTGALHRPRDVADAGAMISAAARASVTNALANGSSVSAR